MNPITNFFFEETIGASAPYGLTISNGILAWVDGSSSPIDMLQGGQPQVGNMSIPNGYQAAVAETAGVVTVTAPASPTAGTEYGFTILQLNPVNKTQATFRVFYTAVTGDTQTIVANRWRTQINDYINAGELFVATSGTTTCILTASTGYPIVSAYGAVGIAGSAIVQTTTGVQSFGYPADLANAGYIVATSSTAAGQGYKANGIYDRVVIVFPAKQGGGTTGQNIMYQTTIFINQNATHYAAAKAYWKSKLQNLSIDGPVTGKAVLSSGTATVSTTYVNASSVIMLTAQVTGGTPGDLYVGTIVDGTSFVIDSTSNTDSSTVGYAIFN